MAVEATLPAPQTRTAFVGDPRPSNDNSGRLVMGLEELKGLYRTLIDLEHVAIDTEAHGPLTGWKPKNKQIVDPLTGRLTGISFTIKGGSSWYVSVAHKDVVSAPVERIQGFVRALFRSDVTWVAHNWKYDLQILRNFVGDQTLTPKRSLDSMVMTHYLGLGIKVQKGKTEYVSHGLKELAERYLGRKSPTYEDTVAPYRVLESGPTDEYLAGLELDMLCEAQKQHPKNRLTKAASQAVLKHIKGLRSQQVWREAQMDEVPAWHACKYACMDTVNTLGLARKMSLDYDLTTPKEWEEVDRLMPEVLADMYATGIMVDQEEVQRIKREVQPGVERLAARWKELTGVSITSAQQCGRALYEDLRMWPVQIGNQYAPRTPTGTWAMNSQALEWAKRHCSKDSMGYMLAEMKEKHSELQKIYTTYTDNLLEQLPYRSDGRLRCQFNAVGTETGRFSCTDPNLQNQPKPSEGLPDIRRVFCAPPGRVLIAADFSQIEIVLIAHFSKDAALADVLLSGKSMHDVTAEALGIDRQTAKVVNFLKNYGGGAKKLAMALGVPLEPRFWKGQTMEFAPKYIQDYCNKYDELYEGVTQYRKDMAAFARKHGYVSTLAGRRRYIPEISSPHKLKQYHAERVASNTPIQGSAADICKKAMVDLYRRWKQYRPSAKLLLQVHDEIVAEVPAENAEVCAEEMRDTMENAVQLTFPLKVSVKYGKNWSECK